MDNNPNKNGKGHMTERELVNNWCIWERYQTSYMQNKSNYLDSNKIIYNFCTIEQFASLWNNSTYDCCSKLFFDSKQNKIKKIQFSNGEEKVVECLMMFKKGIEPKWEDPENHFGGSLIVELKDISSTELDSIWKNLMFTLVGNTFPFSECVNGFRLLDRIKKLKLVKLELWITTGLSAYKKTDPKYQNNYEIKEKILIGLKNLICRTVNISEYSIIFKDHYTANKV